MANTKKNIKRQEEFNVLSQLGFTRVVMEENNALAITTKEELEVIYNKNQKFFCIKNFAKLNKEYKILVFFHNICGANVLLAEQ